MKFSTTLAAVVLPQLALSFPFMAGGMSKEEIARHMYDKRQADNDPSILTDLYDGVVSPIVATLDPNEELGEDLEKRQLLSTLLSDVDGLLGSVAESVNPDNLRPQPGYDFQAPTASDSRGPCPGLNLLANYGYLPRDGYVTLAQVVNATAVGFNMGADLSTLLAVFAVLADGDIATESFYLGAGPGNVGGLNRHSTVEADISVNREDYYLGCGDNHHVSSRMFKANVAYAAAASSKQFDLGVMGQQYVANSKFSQEYNPYLYYFPFPSIVSLGAFVFYPNFFSNGTYGAGGVANYESISSIIGAKLDTETGDYEYVPEQWPENWYRRDTEYGAVDALTQAVVDIYTLNPVGMLIAQLGTPNLNIDTILCDIYTGFNSITPLVLADDLEEASAGATWAVNTLAPFFGLESILGCPTAAISPNYLTSNTSNEGGPLDPPPSVVANTGNDVYNKVYFKTAPTTPQCSHSYSS